MGCNVVKDKFYKHKLMIDNRFDQLGDVKRKSKASTESEEKMKLNGLAMKILEDLKEEISKLERILEEQKRVGQTDDMKGDFQTKESDIEEEKRKLEKEDIEMMQYFTMGALGNQMAN